jgi:benzylsuccinate CoA-transferase BbsF subunit
VSGAAPLRGIKVVDLAWVMAGPLIGRVLADFGATVVRIESGKKPDLARALAPFKDGMPGREQSLFYSDNNAGKLGLALDLSSPDGRAVLGDLLDWGDVVIDSFSPGTMARWGFSWDEVSRRHPDLIMVSASLLGDAGPYGRIAGFGSAGSTISGIHDLGGWPDQPPQGVSGPYSDAINPHFGVMTILAALDRRRRTGRGAYIDLSQVETTLQFVSAVVVDYTANGVVAERNGNRDSAASPHGLYPSAPESEAGARWVAIAVRTDAEWQRLSGIMLRPELGTAAEFATTEARLTNADQVDYLVAEWTRPQTARAVEERLQAAGIAAHRVSTAADLSVDPQLAGLGHFIPLDHAAHGSTYVESSRITLSETPATVARPGPTLGQDTDYVLRDILHYGDARIAELEKAGALA